MHRRATQGSPIDCRQGAYRRQLQTCDIARGPVSPCGHKFDQSDRAVSRAEPAAIVLASTNAHKLTEFRRLFAGSPVQILGPLELECEPTVDESGTTFLENARLKATAFAQACASWSLADDSGLEVDALDGGPGVLSARFAGPTATDAERNAKLLHVLADVPHTRRTARFRCALAVASPAGSIAYAAIRAVEGRIAPALGGDQGFGYDPLFIIGPGNRTVAELTAAEKDSLSHRGRAARAARRFLERYLAST